MNKLLILIVAIILLVILLFSFLAWKGYQISKERALSVSTDQKEYQVEENPKVKIKNNSKETVCFSSCYPYYLERNNGSLKSYSYGSCPDPDVAETCIDPRELKTFEILLVDRMKLEKGIHRIAIPACIGCTLQENFRKDKFFYSNEFLIK